MAKQYHVVYWFNLAEADLFAANTIFQYGERMFPKVCTITIKQQKNS
jgi:hypothetical protein